MSTQLHPWLNSPASACRRFRLSMVGFCLGLWMVCISMAGAPDQTPVVPIDPVAIARELKDGDPQSESWSIALRAYAAPDGRQAVLDAIKARAEFPKASLVSRLGHPELAIRLAALEILEGAAGKDFAFNPWSTDPDDPVNKAALDAWQTWASGDDTATIAAATLDDESMGTYLRDIMAGQRDRAERALRMLEPHGSEATGRIQRFLLDTPNLSDAARARLRSAQYRVVLRPAAGTEAAAVAQRLAFGTRDQQISGLGQLRQFGLASMPIAMNFLEADDPLIRESALDTLLLMGGEGIFPSLKAMLEKETEPNVIHAAIRRFADLRAAGTEELLAKWLGMTDENLVVECLETIAKRAGESYHDFGPSDSGGGGLLGALFGGGNKAKDRTKLNPLQTAVVARLTDPAWRIRASAFQAIAKLRIQGQNEAILKGMDDTDEFVQLAAMEAAAALSMREAVPKMEAIFLAQPERMPVIASGLASMGQPFTDKMDAALAKAPSDAIVGVLAALRARGNTGHNTISKLANHADPDVSAAALGALASGFGESSDDATRDLLVHQLRKGQPHQTRGVIENITLPRSNEDMATVLAARISEVPTGPTTLDPLYDAFLEPLGQGKKDDILGSVDRAPPGALQAALNDIARGERQEMDEDLRFRAAIALLRAGHASAATLLNDGLPSRPASQRAAIAEALSYTSEAIALPMLGQLMLDPAERVRQEAVAAALNNAERTNLAILPLRLLSTEGSVLEPWDVYGYSIESIAAEGRTRGETAAWCKEVLARADAPVPVRVLAATLAPKAGVPVADLESKLDDPSALVRRAVAQAWLRTARDRVVTANRLADDPSPLVREAVPAGLVPVSGHWLVRFNDLRSKIESPSYRYTESIHPMPLRPAEEELLRKMLARENSPSVRFEAAFALLAASKTIDIPAFLRLIPEHPDQEFTRQRIGNFLQSEYERLGKPFAALLLYADTSDFRPGTMEQMKSHFGLNAATLASFNAPPPRDTAPAPAFLDVARETVAVKYPVTLVYFYSPGCAECEKVSRLLENVQSASMAIQIQKHNIKTSEGGLLNQALCLRLGVPSSQQGVSPSIFTPAGALVTTAINAQALDELLVRASATPAPPEWAAISADERREADAALGEKYEQLTLMLVLWGGLLDGINPCAFATIIFFLSYLQVAKRTPRQILGVGIAFIGAIFITYFLAGLVLFQFLSWIDQLAWARKILNGFFALFALGVGLFSLRDAWLARQGRLQDMTLQLPGFLKDRIRSTIRGGARQARYILAAFTSGIIISLLELACTGQVYAPIIHAVQQGARNAIGWLLLYNLAFITPLVLIFLLAFAGMKANALIAFQQKHTALVKLLLGLLFIGLFLLLAFGSHLLPGGRM